MFEFKEQDISDLTVDLMGNIQGNQYANERKEHEITAGEVQNLQLVVIIM